MKPPEEVRRELAGQWLAKADEDLGVAVHLLDQCSPYRNAIGFHAQQAAEKYLKAFLVWHQVEFPKTHDLGELLDLMSAIDPRLADTLEDAISLNPYGVAMRYPGELPETLTDEEARAAVQLANSVSDAIRERLRPSL
jgi:HEPN domain-containing protein